jgi:hypothetical protein
VPSHAAPPASWREASREIIPSICWLIVLRFASALAEHWFDLRPHAWKLLLTAKSDVDCQHIPEVVLMCTDIVGAELSQKIVDLSRANGYTPR